MNTEKRIQANNLNKTNKSILNTITSVLLMLINGVFNFIVIRKVIQVYGSDFNGLNSTAMQFINILLIVEGGFTLASNVALFEPIVENNINKINAILSAVGKQFQKIGLVFLIIGIISAIVYSGLIKTELPRYISFFTLLMLIISTTINLSFSTKYKILFQSDQREYILNLITIITIIFTNVAVLIAISLFAQKLIIRVIIMAFSLLQSLIIIYFCKKSYGFIHKSTIPAFEEIHGTKDVFVQQIVGLFYASIPILFISIFVGTKYASIYAVYNSVFVLIKGLNLSFINAPRMGLGKLIKEYKNDPQYCLNIFNQYEFISFYLIACLLSVAAILMMPFITIYTAGVSDINYKNWIMAVLLIGITLFEMLHIPSGNIINMSGNFKVGKNIQLIAGLVLILSNILGGMLLSIYGILLSILITAFLLALLEIYFVHHKYFKDSWTQFVKSLIFCVLTATILSIVHIRLGVQIMNFTHFFLYAIATVITNSIVIFGVNLLFNKSITIMVLKRIKSTFLLLNRSKSINGRQ